MINSRFDPLMKSVGFDVGYTRLLSPRLSNKLLHSVVADDLLSHDLSGHVDWSLMISHCPGFSLRLQSLLADILGYMPVRIAAFRDPSARYYPPCIIFIGSLADLCLR